MPRSADAAPLALRTTDLFVLAVLADGPQHGYALAQAIADRSGGRVQVRPGDLYRVLYRMDEAGLIEPAPAENRKAGDKRRAYYRITAAGRRTARDHARMLADVCGAMLGRATREAQS